MDRDKSPDAYRAEQAHEARLREAWHQRRLREQQARILLEAHARQAAETWPPLALYESAIAATEPPWYLRGQAGAAW